ncbi:MAG: type I-E CRISPR-associated protein Cas6/Cse3/CasE [Gemmatimonadaceae bacterium]
MTTPLYLSRARLRHDVPAAALRSLLAPPAESARVAASHRLVWTLFADGPERARDFLWREAEPGLFYLLSRRPPADPHGLFELHEPQLFAPALATGDRLGFVLRANATVARGGGRGRRSKPCDVVMDALHAVPREERAAQRRRIIGTVGRAWLAAQGSRAGFTIPNAAANASGIDSNDSDDEIARRYQERSWVRVMGYRTLRLDRGGEAARVGVLDFEGVIEVRDPPTFVNSLARGFGRAKAFGCGLMLVRRA